MRTKATIAIAVLMALPLGWQYLHGGVPAQYLLGDPALPKLSNWWGLLALPLLGWVLLGRVETRRPLVLGGAHGDGTAFAGALAFGVLLSLLLASGQTGGTEYMVLLLPVLALFYPIHRSACALGFMVGMSWLLGPVLPMIGAGLFAAAGALIYHGLRLAFARLMPLLH